MMLHRTIQAAILSALTLAATAGLAMAQPGGGRGRGGFGGGADTMMPAITLRQVDKFSKILSLSKEQKEAADALLEGYGQQASVASKAVRQATDKAREASREPGAAPDPSLWEAVQTASTKFRDDRKKLDDGLLSDLKEILTPQQAEKWPAVERAHRRESTLRWGRMSGERVDLLDLTEKQTMPESAMTQVTPLLALYEEELDRELARRNELYQGAMEKMGELRRTGNMEGMQDIVEKGRQAGKRVRDLNRKYFRQIMDTLPDDAKPTFETAFKQASYPDIYRKSYAGRVAEAGTAMADLSTEQKEKLAALSSRYQAELSPLNEKTAVAQEESEEKFNLQDMANRGWRQEGPLADLRRDRRDLDRKLVEDFKKVLSEDQATRLPERNEDEEGGDRPRNRNRPSAT